MTKNINKDKFPSGVINGEALTTGEEPAVLPPVIPEEILSLIREQVKAELQTEFQATIEKAIPKDDPVRVIEVERRKKAIWEKKAVQMKRNLQNAPKAKWVNVWGTSLGLHELFPNGFTSSFQNVPYTIRFDKPEEEHPKPILEHAKYKLEELSQLEKAKKLKNNMMIGSDRI